MKNTGFFTLFTFVSILSDTAYNIYFSVGITHSDRNYRLIITYQNKSVNKHIKSFCTKNFQKMRKYSIKDKISAESLLRRIFSEVILLPEIRVLHKLKFDIELGNISLGYSLTVNMSRNLITGLQTVQCSLYRLCAVYILAVE